MHKFPELFLKGLVAIWRGPFHVGKLQSPTSFSDLSAKILETAWQIAILGLVTIMIFGLHGYVDEKFNQSKFEWSQVSTETKRGPSDDYETTLKPFTTEQKRAIQNAKARVKLANFASDPIIRKLSRKTKKAIFEEAIVPNPSYNDMPDNYKSEIRKNLGVD
jgi:hypothetical protein